jgi:hypothetical protein
MKKHLLLFLPLLVFGCQRSNEPVEDEPLPMLEVSENMPKYQLVIDKYIESFLTADSISFYQVITDDFKSINMFSSMDTLNAAQTLAFWRGVNQIREDRQMETEGLFSLSVNQGAYKGEWAQWWGMYSATDIASGREFSLPIFMNSQMVDGKISTIYVYYDRLGMMQETGYQLVPPAEQ